MKEKKLTIKDIIIEYDWYDMMEIDLLKQLHKQMKKELISKLLQELNVNYIVKGDEDPREIVNKVFKARCGI